MSGKVWNNYLIIVACFGAGAFLASVVWIFLWLAPTSSEILRLAAWRLFNADSFRVAVDLQYHGQGGDGDSRRAFQWESEGDFERRADGVWTVHDFTLHLGGGESPLRLGGQISQRAKVKILTLKEVPERFGSLNLQSLKDKTLRVNLESALKNLPSVPYVGGLRLTDADRRELMDIAIKLPFLAIQEKLPDETVSGVTAYHYKVKLEIIYARDFLKLVEAKRLGRELSAKELNEYDATFADYAAEEGELWLGTGDYFVQRLRLHLRRVGYGSNEGGLWTLTLNFSRPADGTRLDQISAAGVEDATPYIDSLLAAYASYLPMAKAGSTPRSLSEAGGLPTVTTPSPASIDFDEDNLPFLLETFYGTDGLNPDSDGDGYRDGQEVDDGRSPMGPWGLFDFTQGQFR